MLNKYLVIRRFVIEGDTDLTSVHGADVTYEGIHNMFQKDKEALLQSLEDRSKTIIVDNDEMIHIQYGEKDDLRRIHQYSKIISLY